MKWRHDFQRPKWEFIWMSVSVGEYTYGMKVDIGSTNESVLQLRIGIGMWNYVALSSPNAQLLESAVQNFYTIRRLQAKNPNRILQIFYVSSISNKNQTSDLSLVWNLPLEIFFENKKLLLARRLQTEVLSRFQKLWLSTLDSTILVRT